MFLIHNVISEIYNQMLKKWYLFSMFLIHNVISEIYNQMLQKWYLFSIFLIHYLTAIDFEPGRCILSYSIKTSFTFTIPFNKIRDRNQNIFFYVIDTFDSLAIVTD